MVWTGIAKWHPTNKKLQIFCNNTKDDPDGEYDVHWSATNKQLEMQCGFVSYPVKRDAVNKRLEARSIPDNCCDIVYGCNDCCTNDDWYAVNKCPRFITVTIDFSIEMESRDCVDGTYVTEYNLEGNWVYGDAATNITLYFTGACDEFITIGCPSPIECEGKPISGTSGNGCEGDSGSFSCLHEIETISWYPSDSLGNPI